MSPASTATLAYKAEAMNLGSLLSGTRSYAIPIFQRSYSWSAREISQLISDLWLGVEEAREGQESYGGLFIGSLIVVDKSRLPNASQLLAEPEAFQVIDGKQRLTTLTILLAALRDRLGAEAPWIDGLLSRVGPQGQGANGPARLTLGLEEDSYFGAQVRRPGATREPIEPDSDSHGRRSIRECQQIIVEDLDERSDGELAELAAFLRDQVALALISAPDIDTGYRAFLTTNTRGKPLSATDILKAELISGVPENQREQCLERWRAAEKMLGEDFGQLPGYLRMIHGSRHGATIHDVLELSQRRGGAKRFLDEILFPVADALHPILNASHAGAPESERINRALRILGWLRARDWVAPALAFACRYPEQPEAFAVFLEALERLAYGLQVIGTGADRRNTRYRQVIEALDTGVVMDGSQAPLALDLEEQGKFMLNVTCNLYERNSTTCKYLLKRISASYPGDESALSLADVTIEHLLPTNVPDKSPWLKQIPDPQERQACNRLLGNLSLVSKQQNKEARNQGLDAKLRVLFPDGQPSAHAITNHLIGARSWNAVDIRARDALLLKRVREIWNISDQAVPPSRRPGKAS